MNPTRANPVEEIGCCKRVRFDIEARLVLNVGV